MTHPAETSLSDATVTLFGSWQERRLPSELGRLFKDGILIDPRNGLPMEMDAYSAYLTLTALELRLGVVLKTEKRILVDAIVARLNEESPFTHGVWTPRDVHMRFTAAAVRLLSEASRDGLLPDPSALVGAVRFHLSFSERLKKGLWFLHDNLEFSGWSEENPARFSRNNVWGSSTKNTLVLNTHLDTLSTLIDILPLFTLDEAQQLREKIADGLDALDFVLTQRSRGWGAFSAADRIYRTLLFNSYGNTSREFIKIRELATKAYSRFRMHAKSIAPGYAMGDGYIERDIGFPGIYFEYHMLNVQDISRLIYKLRAVEYQDRVALTDELRRIADRGIDYAISSEYVKVMESWRPKSGRAIALCEAILLRVGDNGGKDIPDGWLRAYCAIRRQTAPTSAIVGYDPYTVLPAEAGPVDVDHDLVNLIDGRRLSIDFRHDSRTWL
jgi:hypothetical protein